MRNAVKVFPSILFAICTFSSILWSQQPCSPPKVDLTQSGSNIFSSRQEQELGEIMASGLTHHRITDDPAVTGYMARIGKSLSRHLPSVGFHFRYFVVESPVPNAYSAPGGRIYLTRVLIAQLQSPDELAAILGHEMGHIVTHQSAIDATFLLERVLKVTQVTDRQDIQKKLDDLEANWRRDRAAFQKVAHQREQKQLVADQLGLYAITAAGYSPEVYPKLFERITLTGDSTGTWFSDLFHTTTPDQLRLRALLKTEEAMPRGCIEQHPGVEIAGFQRWRKTVLDFAGWGKRRENLHGVVAQVKLEPLTVGSVNYVRFSPDGRYLLAEKERNLYIFIRSPFAFLFRIYAPVAWQAHFTTDSRSVAFIGAGSRVQLWDLTSQKRLLAYTPQLASPCTASLLSPDATKLACLRGDGVLDLIEIPSGKIMLEKQGFATPAHPVQGILFIPTATLAFSPDGHYFLARGHSETLALDLTNTSPVRLPGKLRSRLNRGFIFLSDGRLLTGPSGIGFPLASMVQQGPYFSLLSTWIFNGQGSENPSALFEFPSGKIVSQMWLRGLSHVYQVTHGDYLLVGPMQKHPLGILDLKSRKVVCLLDQPAADDYGATYAHQIRGGDMGLFDVASAKLQSQAAFPPGDESDYVRALASPELKWLAASKGAIWNLATGKMVYHLRTFEGGGFEGENTFYVDFPAYRDTPRTTARFDLSRMNVTPERKIWDMNVTQFGLYEVVKKAEHPGGLQGMIIPCGWKYPDFDPVYCNVDYEVRDALSGKKLWGRRFKKDAPLFRMEPEQTRAVISWPVSDSAVADEIKKLPQLEGKWAAARKQPAEDFVEILDLSNGSVLHAMFIKGGMATYFLTSGQRLLAAHRGYVEIYSLTTGAEEGSIPGRPSAVSLSGDLLTVRSDAPNMLEVYDLRSRKRVNDFSFPSDVGFDQFSRDGKRLLVVTVRQTAYILDVRARPMSASIKP